MIIKNVRCRAVAGSRMDRGVQLYGIQSGICQIVQEEEKFVQLQVVVFN